MTTWPPRLPPSVGIPPGAPCRRALQVVSGVYGQHGQPICHAVQQDRVPGLTAGILSTVAKMACRLKASRTSSETAPMIRMLSDSPRLAIRDVNSAGPPDWQSRKSPTERVGSSSHEVCIDNGGHALCAVDHARLQDQWAIVEVAQGARCSSVDRTKTPKVGRGMLQTSPAYSRLTLSAAKPECVTTPRAESNAKPRRGSSPRFQDATAHRRVRPKLAATAVP